ncbi:MAG: hypothetical protein EZS28_047809, partial [Streblomastix strix]
LNQTAHTPEEQQHQQQIASAQLLIEQYYDEKVADYDPTGKRPTKRRELQEKTGDLDLEFEAEVCKLAIDCQRAFVAAIASLVTNDAESATEWIHSSHHLALIIAGKAQQRREQALAPPMFKGLLGPDVSASGVFWKKSKEMLKEKAKTTKLIEHPKEISATILDIKDAFHHVHVSPNLQPFLEFLFKNKSCTYLGLPFCCRLRHLLFSKTLVIAIRAIREKWKMKIQNYMGDIILIHQSKQQLKQMTLEIVFFLSNLGWRLSPTKCVITPRKCFQYLGYSFQTQSMEVTMTQIRRRGMKHKLKEWIQMTNENQIVTIRSLASLIGEINYLRFQFPQISLWMNAINKLKTRAIAKGGWDASVRLQKISHAK